jgi:hypothetical protein
MNDVRPEDRAGIDGRNDDSDIVIQTPTGTAVDTGAPVPCPEWALEQSRAFGRRGDKAGFDRWLVQQSSYEQNRARLRQEFERALADEPMESWRRVFRQGILPHVSSKGLEGLQRALERNDARILMGASTNPPALSFNEHEPLEGCCPIGWLLLEGKPPYSLSVGTLDQMFGQLCWKCEQACGLPASIGFFLRWWDEGPRESVRAALLVEVNAALIGRIPEASEPERTVA